MKVAEHFLEKCITTFIFKNYVEENAVWKMLIRVSNIPKAP